MITKHGHKMKYQEQTEIKIVIIYIVDGIDLR